MKIKDFKSGNWIKQFEYKSFSPSLINHSWQLDDEKLILMLSEADKLLGELNAFSAFIPDVDFFIQMHIFKEATTSSKIEGTQTNIEEALQKIHNIDPEKKDDWQEVNNYTIAMNKSIDLLKSMPLCNRLLKIAHETLMNSVRGETKQPGEFRKSQNWIGGASIKDAVFVPPIHHEIGDLMSDLELFLQNRDILVPKLIKIAIAHYQFQTIHPFLDGNGRTGRLLITLFLVSEGYLSKPTLYLSDFFNKHRILYYDNLQAVRNNSNLLQWLYFFLEGVIQTAVSSKETFQKIITLKEDIEKNRLSQLGKKRPMAQKLIDHLYAQPIVETDDIVNEFQINKTTALRLIDDFIRLGILIETTGFKRNRIFVFKEYVGFFL